MRKLTFLVLLTYVINIPTYVSMEAAITASKDEIKDLENVNLQCAQNLLHRKVIIIIKNAFILLK